MATKAISPGKRQLKKGIFRTSMIIDTRTAISNDLRETDEQAIQSIANQ
jgi:hypothetical protein